MIAIDKVRTALSEVDDALAGKPKASSRLPGGPHRVVWIPDQAGPVEALASEDARRNPSPRPPSRLVPFLDLTPQREADLANALAQIQPTGTLLGTPLGETSADAIASCHSFHEFETQWGVYFSASALLGYAKALFPKTPLSKSTPFVWRFVLHHELFHFGIEYAVAQLECMTGKAIYRLAQTFFGDLAEDEYPYNQPEEALCNGYALRQMTSTRPRPRNAQEILRRNMAQEKPGYRDGIKYETDRAFEEGFREYIINAVSFPGPSGTPLLETKTWSGLDLLSLLPGGGEIPEGSAPIIILDDFAEHGLPPFTIGVQQFTSLATVEESARFQKKLSKLDHLVRKQWEAQKRRLTQQTTFGFEFWERTSDGPVYSVRVGDNFRAHILVVDPATKAVALDIGNHKAMGHG
ncbi:MAG: hypothetical protein Q8L14_09270 [Myxococcales bacterium]|nr:hypothetical protein [Myxococcales bacterium]